MTTLDDYRSVSAYNTSKRVIMLLALIFFSVFVSINPICIGTTTSTIDVTTVVRISTWVRIANRSLVHSYYGILKVMSVLATTINRTKNYWSFILCRRKRITYKNFGTVNPRQLVQERTRSLSIAFPSA